MTLIIRVVTVARIVRGPKGGVKERGVWEISPNIIEYILGIP